jgi:hypothetical protein
MKYAFVTAAFLSFVIATPALAMCDDYGCSDYDRYHDSDQMQQIERQIERQQSEIERLQQDAARSDFPGVLGHPTW